MFPSKILLKSLRASVRIGQISRRRPTKDIMTLTARAETQINKLLIEEPNSLLRIGLKTKGCNGQAYHIDFIKPEEREPLDEEIRLSDGQNKIYVHRRAQISIIGTEMDYETNRLHEGFVFVNPNAKGTCGCGESFNI